MRPERPVWPQVKQVFSKKRLPSGISLDMLKLEVVMYRSENSEPHRLDLRHDIMWRKLLYISSLFQWCSMPCLLCTHWWTAENTCCPSTSAVSLDLRDNNQSQNPSRTDAWYDKYYGEIRAWVSSTCMLDKVGMRCSSTWLVVSSYSHISVKVSLCPCDTHDTTWS